MKLLYQTETYSVISFILISIMALASIAIIYLAKKEIDKSENEIINLKKLYDFIKIVKSQRFFFISFGEMKKNL